MASFIKNIIGILTPFSQLLILQKLFTNTIINNISKIIPDYTNDDTGMYKIIDYYGTNKNNLSKIYFFLSLFAKQLNYGEYDEKTKTIIDDIKNRFFNLIDDVYKNNMEKKDNVINLKSKIIAKNKYPNKTKSKKYKISKMSKVSKTYKASKTKIPEIKRSINNKKNNLKKSKQKK
jgi:hypothetical protein